MKSLEIINKIESKKVELGMNVELGLLQETFSKIDNINNESKKSFEMVQKAKTLLVEAESLENSIIKKYESVYVELTKLIGTVKNLGLPTAEIDNKLKLVKGYISNNQTASKRINQSYKTL